jgi:hypothetical protein
LSIRIVVFLFLVMRDFKLRAVLPVPRARILSRENSVPIVF